MNLKDVITEVAAQLDTIDGLRSLDFPPDHLSPPMALPEFPEEYSFDETYGRGMDRMILPWWIVVGKPSDRSTVERLGRYVDGSGANSVKQVVEAGTYNAFDIVRVMSVEFEPIDDAGITYVGARFSLDIAGKGST